RTVRDRLRGRLLAAVGKGMTHSVYAVTGASELGGSAFDLFELAEAMTKVTSTNVRYRDLSVDEYKEALQRSGLDENAAEFVAALDASIAAVISKPRVKTLSSYSDAPPLRSLT